MVKKTNRAVLINKDEDPYINKEDLKQFLKEFLKASKNQMASPPTKFEKALIIAKPIEEIKNKPTKKVILPEIVIGKKKTIILKPIHTKKKKNETKNKKE